MIWVVIMSDIEGLARRLLANGTDREAAARRLTQEILDFKDTTSERAKSLAMAVLGEVENSSMALQNEGAKVLHPIFSGVTMGQQGVGCRGTGDFFVHRLVAELFGPREGVALPPQDMDDAGAIAIGEGGYLVAKMEGMHSRLSDFPFLAGFHVTRAAFRDLYVKGATPGGLLVDMHLADDADVGKLFDFMAGVASVCELAGCPILGGSTLRIGGDMVIGSRITGGVAAIGMAKRLFPRRDVRKGDAIIMTEGSGGGTICTTAIYSGRPEVVQETLNIKFLSACKSLLEGKNQDSIHCMADVTNGGIRADLHEIEREAGCGGLVNEDAIEMLTNKKVKELLDQSGVDYLGVSLDSLLIFCDQCAADSIINELSEVGVEAAVIGKTTEVPEIMIVRKDGVSQLLPRFRESAYTEIKKVVDSEEPKGVRMMERMIRSSAEGARLRKEAIIDRIRDV